MISGRVSPDRVSERSSSFWARCVLQWIKSGLGMQAVALMNGRSALSKPNGVGDSRNPAVLRGRADVTTERS